MKVQEAYENIEKIVTYGFLPLGVRCCGRAFVLKTTTDKEFHFLPILSMCSVIDYTVRRLVLSTYIIDGVNVLPDRNKHLRELMGFYKGMPASVFGALSEAMDKVYQEYIDSLKYLEGFCYTGKSRRLWQIFNNNTNNSGFYSGVEGSQGMGLNIVQENWIVVNQGLDSENNYETQFQLSLMVASAFSGKAAKEIGGRYDFHKKERDDLRDEIIKYGYDKRRIVEERRKKGWARPIRTREDLVRELNREMSGAKDKHDTFIERWIENQKNAAEDARKAALQKQQEFRANVVEDATLEKQESSRIATPEEVEKLMARKSRAGMAVPSDAYKKDDEKARMVKKLSKTVIR